MSILSQIIAYSPNKIDTEKKAKTLLLAEVPRSEMDNFNTPDLDQGADSILRPGETLEDFDVEFRRPNAQGGMQQLVQPNADGSRPGYSGKKEVLSKTKFIELITKNSDKTYNEFVEILNKDYTAAGGKSFTKGIIADRARAYDLSGTLSKKEPEGRSEESKEKRRIAENKRYYEMKKTEKGRAKQKKYRLNAKAKEYLNLGIDPPASTPEESLWKDAVTSAKKNKDGNGRFSFKSGYEKSMSRKNFFSNKIKIVDNVTGKTFNYNNYKNFIIKNAKSFGINSYDDAIKPYRQKKFVNTTPGLRNSVNSALIPNYDAGNKTNAFTVQHDLGRQKNPLKVSLAFYDENTKEYYARDNFEKAWEKSKKSKTPLDDRKKAFNIFKTEIDKLNVVSQPSMIKRNRSFGKELDLTEGLKIAKKKGAKIPYGTFKKLKTAMDNNFLELAGTVTDQCKIGNATGGRIGFKTAGGVDCLNIGKKTAKDLMEKGLKNGFEKGAQGDLARKILGTGKFLKDAVSLRGLFGPAALAFTAAAEAGIVGYDMLSSGKSFREAVGDSVFNYMLGDKTKIDSVEERNKRMIEEGMTPEQMGKIGAMESALDELNTFGSQFNKLDAIQKNRDAISMSPEDTFNEGAFQLDLDKQEDAVRENIQDFNRTGGPQRLQNIDYAGGFENLAEGLRRNELAQLQSVDNPLQSRRGDEKRSARIQELMLQNPDIRNYMGSYPTNYGFMGGGIASLNVNKK